MRMENLKTSEIKKYIIIERQEVAQSPNSWGPGVQGSVLENIQHLASKQTQLHSQSAFETLNYCSQERKKMQFLNL